MRMVIGSLLVVLLCACGERHGTGTLMETKQGVFYVSLLGNVYLFSGGRFVLAERIEDVKKSAKVLTIEQKLGSTGYRVQGKVKLQKSVAYVQFDVLPDGSAKSDAIPSDSDQVERLVDTLAKGGSPITGVTLHILDTDGFDIASNDFELPGSGWSRVVGESGKLKSFRQQSQFTLNPEADVAAESARVGWRRRRD